MTMRVGSLSPVRPSISSEQRRRRFFGLAGSQTPQLPPMRGTPPDEPQPMMVAMIAVAAAISGLALREQPVEIGGRRRADLLEA